tara:strand:- start:79 stop:681 length:603 start_codon:yes stop_codon:yes gene_type:complete
MSAAVFEIELTDRTERRFKVLGCLISCLNMRRSADDVRYSVGDTPDRTGLRSWFDETPFWRPILDSMWICDLDPPRGWIGIRVDLPPERVDASTESVIRVVTGEHVAVPGSDWDRRIVADPDRASVSRPKIQHPRIEVVAFVSVRETDLLESTRPRPVFVENVGGGFQITTQACLSGQGKQDKLKQACRHCWLLVEAQGA